jgi:hypothetical protein
VTLADILLFGTDQLILTVCPAHRTDLILRDAIFREVASDMLIHREYTNGTPARPASMLGRPGTDRYGGGLLAGPEGDHHRAWGCGQGS